MIVLTAAAVALGIYLAVSLLYWLWSAYAMFRMGHSVAYLDRVDPPVPPLWPRLSIVVAACDEADKIAPAARSLLACDYDDLEVVLVDDRSTDDTGAIIDALAGEDPRVRALHIRELPAGWLGKVHALHQGLAHCTGEFILFTDADVHFQPPLLRRAVAYCLAGNLDHLAALPSLWPTGLLLDAMIAESIRELVTVIRMWRVADPASRAFMGVGAFNLVRRSAFDATEGFEWLRMEVADDAGLGMMMKRSGARCELVNAFGLAALHWYRTFGEIVHGSQRTFATASNLSVRNAFVFAGLVVALELSPLLAPLGALAFRCLGPPGWAGLAFAVAGLAAPALYIICELLAHRWSRRKLLPGLLSAAMSPVGAWMVLRAALLARRRGGIVWRGTLYPTEALRAGKRIRLP
jgi:cellulose synthase/poly-beta-1,6-N-acetylglucosamine synthase-like glycosyltransferase